VWLVGGWNIRESGEAVLTIDVADGAFGKWARDKGADDVFDQLAADVKRCDATTLFTDQRDMNHVSSGCRRGRVELWMQERPSLARGSRCQRG
jgi:hypothetical protein